MKHIKSIIRIAAAILFVLPLAAAYSISRETIAPIIFYKIVWPLDILPKDHYTPWHDVVSAAAYALALMPSSFFCGAFFGYVFRRKTALWAIVPSSGLVAYFLIFLRNHWYSWTVYYAYGFLVLSFICFSALGSKLYRKWLIDGPQSRMNQNARVRERVILASVIFVTVAGAGWLHFYYSLLGTRVSGEGFEGIILSKTFVENIGSQGASSWWDVQDIDIRTLEDHLRSYVKAHRDVLGTRLTSELPSYRRWYHSESSAAGNRQIHVFLMHESQVSRPQWLHQLFGVAGGGDYYWHMTYTVKDGTFENVRCNADA